MSCSLAIASSVVGLRLDANAMRVLERTISGGFGVSESGDSGQDLVTGRMRPLGVREGNRGAPALFSKLQVHLTGIKEVLEVIEHAAILAETADRTSAHGTEFVVCHCDHDGVIGSDIG